MGQNEPENEAENSLKTGVYKKNKPERTGSRSRRTYWK